MKISSYEKGRIKKDSLVKIRGILFMIFFILFLSLICGICTAANEQKKENPSLTIDPIGNHALGEVFDITGTSPDNDEFVSLVGHPLLLLYDKTITNESGTFMNYSPDYDFHKDVLTYNGINGTKRWQYRIDVNSLMPGEYDLLIYDGSGVRNHSSFVILPPG